MGVVVAAGVRAASGQAGPTTTMGYPVTPQSAPQPTEPGFSMRSYPVTPYAANTPAWDPAAPAAAMPNAPAPQPAQDSIYPSEPASYPPPAAFAASDSALAEATPCLGAQLVARVGGTAILQSDIDPIVTKLLDINKKQLQFDQLSPADREAARKILSQKAVEYLIDSKLTYEDARRTVPAENFKKIHDDVGDHFEKKVVPMWMKREGYASRAELEAGLRAKGSSYEHEKRIFVEQYVADTWKKQSVKVSQEVTHEQLLEYYQEHIADFTHQAQARWEELVVRKAKHADPEEARFKLAEMGNRVLNGEAFADVAKAESEGPTAASGGARDWTTQGALVSKVLDQVLFGLPVGQMSQIIEDNQGFYIVRVVERKEGGQTPFGEAHTEIRKKIREERREKEDKAYVARLRAEIPVWTVFDSEHGGE